MNTYIALLRGINVGGHNKIKMKELENIFIELGFKEVKTYIQSGNVVFKADENLAVSERIEALLSKEKGLDIKILLIEAGKFGEILRRNPFAGSNFDEKAVYVSFALANVGEIGRDKVLLKKAESEEIYFSEDAVYFYCPDGYGKTKLSNNFLETNLKVLLTTRNLNSCREIEKLATI